ncbi:MAG: hypothetical protein EBR82_23685 [Caulobacteraceae bacterium]|nr:hypothetical protein [Caulobacteraceae bacterium]
MNWLFFLLLLQAVAPSPPQQQTAYPPSPTFVPDQAAVARCLNRNEGSRAAAVWVQCRVAPGGRPVDCNPLETTVPHRDMDTIRCLASAHRLTAADGTLLEGPVVRTMFSYDTSTGQTRVRTGN